MTLYELIHRLLRPFDHPLRQRVWRALAELHALETQTLLDVGGRRSQYTIGLPGRITVSDIPRSTELQSKLDLGATETIRRAVLDRRSNVVDYVLDDMTQTALPPASFDVVVAVEVLEHVEEDDAFVRNVARVLNSSGTFLMTTPNGDFLPTPYPDHKRHYRHDQLRALLSRHFERVSVGYAVNHGRLMTLGVQRPSLRHPFRTLCAMPALAMAAWIERAGIGGQGPQGKRHLIATARQPRRDVTTHVVRGNATRSVVGPT
jgi:SAM-dependent methyltransferase